MDATNGSGLPSALIAGGPVGRGAVRGVDATMLTARQEGFASVMARAVRDPKKSVAEQTRESAEQFVAMTLVQPLLKQLRENSKAAPPFAPSSGEKQFQSMLDAQVSQQIVHSSNFPLVDVVARRLLGRNGAAPALAGQANGDAPQ